MSEISDKFPGCNFYSGEYNEFSSILYNNQIVEERLSEVTTLTVKTNDKTKSLGHVPDFFPNLHTIKIFKAKKVNDFDFLKNLKSLKEVLIDETQSQKNWEFLKDMRIDKLTVYNNSNVAISDIPNTLSKLVLNGSFDYSSLCDLTTIKELTIDNSSGNPFIKEVKDLPDEFELPPLPESLEHLTIRGYCRLTSSSFLQFLNDTCKIYIPDKGCKDLLIPERFTNVSR
jgi:hypothetical protein